jgi:hypothetical protein
MKNPPYLNIELIIWPIHVALCKKWADGERFREGSGRRLCLCRLGARLRSHFRMSLPTSNAPTPPANVTARDCEDRRILGWEDYFLHTGEASGCYAPLVITDRRIPIPLSRVSNVMRKKEKWMLQLTSISVIQNIPCLANP